MVWYFIDVDIINRTLHGRLEIRNFSSRVEKIFHHSKGNFVSLHGHVISSIYYINTNETEYIADSIKVALGIGKLLFGGHSSKSLHCSICPKDRLPKQPALFWFSCIVTRWAFAQKHDIFMCENNMLFSHAKRSPLLLLHNKSHLLQQKAIKAKWFWYFIDVYIINRTLHEHVEMQKFSSRVKKYFKSERSHVTSSVDSAYSCSRIASIEHTHIIFPRILDAILRF